MAYRSYFVKRKKMKDGTFFVERWDPNAYFITNLFGCLFELFLLPFRIMWVIIKAPFKFCVNIYKRLTFGKKGFAKLLWTIIALLIIFAVIVVVVSVIALLMTKAGTAAGTVAGTVAGTT